MKQVLIRQPAGLGDILYTQKIYKDLESMGYEVIWPVIDEFLWLNDYTDSKFVSINDNFPYKNYYNQNYIIKDVDDNFIFIPLQDADKHHINMRIMESKYKMVNIDPVDWSDFLVIKRNTDKEDELYRKLGLSEGEDYSLILRNYGSPPNHLKFPINYQGTLKVIELDFMEGYTLFDWCKVIESASEIYLIDSSINYLIEKLTLKSNNLFLFTRRHNNFTEIDYLFKTKYNYTI